MGFTGLALFIKLKLFIIIIGDGVCGHLSLLKALESLLTKLAGAYTKVLDLHLFGSGIVEQGVGEAVAAIELDQVEGLYAFKYSL